ALVVSFELGGNAAGRPVSEYTLSACANTPPSHLGIAISRYVSCTPLPLPVAHGEDTSGFEAVAHREDSFLLAIPPRPHLLLGSRRVLTADYALALVRDEC